MGHCRHPGPLQLQGLAPVVCFTDSPLTPLWAATSLQSAAQASFRVWPSSSARSPNLSYLASLSPLLLPTLCSAGCLLVSGQAFGQTLLLLLLLSSTISYMVLQTPGHSQSHSTCSPWATPPLPPAFPLTVPLVFHPWSPRPTGTWTRASTSPFCPEHPWLLC